MSGKRHKTSSRLHNGGTTEDYKKTVKQLQPAAAKGTLSKNKEKKLRIARRNLGLGDN